MSKKQHIKKELEELDSPILTQWQGKAKDWSIPDDYINNLANQVITQSTNERETKILTFNRSIIWQIAATVLFLLAGTWLFLSFQSTSVTQSLTSLEETSIEEIQEYVLDNIDDFDLNLLEELASNTNSDDFFQINGVLLDSNMNEEYDWLEENMEIDLF